MGCFLRFKPWRVASFGVKRGGRVAKWRFSIPDSGVGVYTFYECKFLKIWTFSLIYPSQNFRICWLFQRSSGIVWKWKLWLVYNAPFLALSYVNIKYCRFIFINVDIDWRVFTKIKTYQHFQTKLYTNKYTNANLNILK